MPATRAHGGAAVTPALRQRDVGRPAMAVGRSAQGQVAGADHGPRRRLSSRRRPDVAAVPDAELPAVARALARSLAAGLPIGPALRRAADAVDERSAAALARAADRIVAGDDPDAALHELGPGAAARLLRAAVAVNVELGGDLVHALEALAEGLADRNRLRGELEIATAQAKLTTRIVPAVPGIALATLALTDRASLRALVTTGAGLAILGISLTLTVIGLLVVNRILAGALR